MNSDQEIELLNHVAHIAESVDMLCILVCILLGVVIALQLTGRK